MLRKTIFAPGMAAPDGSVTVPVTVPLLMDCGTAGIQNRRAKKITRCKVCGYMAASPLAKDRHLAFQAVRDATDGWPVWRPRLFLTSCAHGAFRDSANSRRPVRGITQVIRMQRASGRDWREQEAEWRTPAEKRSRTK